MAILTNKSMFQYPRTPGFKASLMDLPTEPSHRISGNLHLIGWEADPAVVRQYVPEPLELDGSGLCYLMNYDGWVVTDRQSSEFVSEPLVNYTESFFWIPCDFEGERVHFMTYSWVTRDWLAYLGRHIGQPHKISQVHMTRFHPTDPVYNGPGEGVRVNVRVDNYGTVLRGHTDLERQIEPKDMPIRISNDYCPRFCGHRYVYDVVEDRPVLNDLVVHWGDDMVLGPIWTGPSELEFYSSENEDVLPFKPRRMVGGWWFTLLFNHSTSQPKVIHRFGN